MVTLPWISVTVQVTVVVPTGYVVDAWSLVTDAIAQLSVVTGVPILATVAEQSPASAVWFTVDGQLTTGASLSVTMMVC